VACLTDSQVTVFSLAQGGFSVVGSVHVNDIVDSAGAKFASIEGTLVEAVFSPKEDLLFLSTLDSLVGVVKIEQVVPPEEPEEEAGQSSMASRPYGEQLFSMRLVSVLLFPVPRVVLFAAAPECLYVVGKDKRALFVIDWGNYQARATRFVIPSFLDSGDPGSPCINSVLPQNVDIDFNFLEVENIHVSQALVVPDSDALVLLYDNGTVRSLARSRPSDKMCVFIPTPSAHILVAEKNKLAIASGNMVHVYQLEDHQTHSLLFQQTMQSRVTCMSWSEGFLVIGGSEGFSLLNRQGTGILIFHPSDSPYKHLVLSLPMRVIASVKHNSSEVGITNLNVSSDLFSKSFSASQGQLLLGRDSLQLYTFPQQQWKFIAAPASYIQDNGILRSACVQINPSSKFVLAVAERGFALWSSTSSAFASMQKREGKWELLADKSQEEKLGEIDHFGFLSETVFFTHSTGGKELILWSVLKRVDLDYSLSVTKLTSGAVKLSACDSARGLLVLTYEREARMDVFHLKGDSKNATYSLELISKLPTDFPENIGKLQIVGNHTVLGISDSDEVFLRTGERVCGNADRMFIVNSLGLDVLRHRTMGSQSTTIMTTAVPTDDVSSVEAVTPPRLTTPTIATPAESETGEEIFSDLDDREPDIVPSEATFGPAASPAMYFIGETECRFCASAQRIPKVKRKIFELIQKGNPLIYMQDVRGNIAVWVVVSSGRFAGGLEYVIRFDEPFATGSQLLAVSGEWGVMASVNPGGHIALSSAVHPLLSILPTDDCHKLCVRLEPSPFFIAILEMYLHTTLSSALGILGRIHPDAINVDCLKESSEATCQHPLVRNVLDRLLQSFNVCCHFPSVFGSVFAAAVRKSEPHITFPLASCGAFTNKPAEQLFKEIMELRRLREAALLLVILQEKSGPVVVREQFGIPLFREALLEQQYVLADEIAHFHFSYAPGGRTLFWAPHDDSSRDVIDTSLRTEIDVVVISHLNFLVNESMDLLRVVRCSQTLKLVLGEWLKRLPRNEYSDLTQLVSAFRVCWLEEVVINLLVEAFRRAGWVSHWRALAVASESSTLVRDCLEQTKEDNSSTVTEADVLGLMNKYLN
jgi:hypothetical protein